MFTQIWKCTFPKEDGKHYYEIDFIIPSGKKIIPIEDASRVSEILEHIYSLAHMDIGQLRSETKLSASAFSRLFGIPIRTAQSWEYKERRTPEYALLLISYAIFMEGMDDE